MSASISTLSHLYVEEMGEKGKPPLVMLHGWGQTLESLKPLARLLETHYHLFLIDLPGFGKSPPPSTTWSSFDYADHLMAFLDEKGLQRAIFLGHSFGGKVSMSIANRYPERVSALILMAPAGLKRKRTWKEHLRFRAIRWLGKSCKAMDQLFSQNLFEGFFVPRFASSDWKNAGPMKAILVKSVNENFQPHLKKIQAPTLLLWGEADTETPIEMAHRLHHQISASQLIVYPKKGHHLHKQMGSHLCAFHLHAFLKQKGFVEV